MSGSVIGALRIVLGADTAAFEKGLSGAQKTLKRFDRDMQKMAAGFKSVGQSLTLGLTLPIVALGAKMAQTAIDAAEMQSAFEVSFGAMAKSAKDWATTTGDAMGRSTTEMQQGMLTMHGLFKAGGPATDQTRKLAEQFAVLAQDLSSFHNVSPEDALDRLRAGLSGEAEPLRRFNVYLTEAAVKAEALRLGLVKGNGVLSETAKIQARASLIMKGTTEAQGDVIRTSSSAANQIRAMKAAWQELSITLGEKIVPLLTPIVVSLNGMATKFAALSPQMQKFVLIGGAIAAALGPALIGIGLLLSALGSIAVFMAGPTFALIAAAFWPVTLAVAAVVGVFLLFRKEIEAGLERVKGVIEGVFGPKLAAMVAAFGELWQALKPAIQPLIDAFAGAWSVEMTKFGEAVSRVFDAIVTVIIWAMDGITAAIKAVAYLLSGEWAVKLGLASRDAVHLAVAVIKAFATLSTGAIGWVRKTWEGVKLWLVDKFTTIVNAVGEKVHAVAGFFKALWDAVVGHSYVPDMVDGIRDEFARLDEVMVKPAEAAARKVSAAFAGIPGINIQNPAARLDQSKGGNNGGEVLTPLDVANDVDLQPGPNAAAWGGKIFSPEALADMREQFIGFGKDLAGAIQTGNLPEFFQSIAAKFADTLLNRALNTIFDALGSGGGQGGGLGAILSAVFSGGPIPGFATGGSFKVGGSGGIDSQLMQFRATPGEMVDVRHGNDNGGRGATNVFDMRGAVVTQDLLNQMNSIAATGDMRVIGAIQKERTREQQAIRYRVAR